MIEWLLAQNRYVESNMMQMEIQSRTSQESLLRDFVKNKKLTMKKHLHRWQDLKQLDYYVHMLPTRKSSCTKWM